MSALIPTVLVLAWGAYVWAADQPRMFGIHSHEIPICLGAACFSYRFSHGTCYFPGGPPGEKVPVMRAPTR